MSQVMNPSSGGSPQNEERPRRLYVQFDGIKSEALQGSVVCISRDKTVKDLRQLVDTIVKKRFGKGSSVTSLTNERCFSLQSNHLIANVLDDDAIVRVCVQKQVSCLVPMDTLSSIENFLIEMEPQILGHMEGRLEDDGIGSASVRFVLGQALGGSTSVQIAAMQLITRRIEAFSGEVMALLMHALTMPLQSDVLLEAIKLAMALDDVNAIARSPAAVSTVLQLVEEGSSEALVLLAKLVQVDADEGEEALLVRILVASINNTSVNAIVQHIAAMMSWCCARTLAKKGTCPPSPQLIDGLVLLLNSPVQEQALHLLRGLMHDNDDDTVIASLQRSPNPSAQQLLAEFKVERPHESNLDVEALVAMATSDKGKLRALETLQSCDSEWLHSLSLIELERLLSSLVVSTATNNSKFDESQVRFLLRLSTRCEHLDLLSSERVIDVLLASVQQQQNAKLQVLAARTLAVLAKTNEGVQRAARSLWRRTRADASPLLQTYLHIAAGG